MPRVEIRKGPNNLKADNQNVNLFADICNHCYHEVHLQHMSVGDNVPDDLIEAVDEIEIGDQLASLAVEHTSYEADPTMCCMCDDTLLEEDNLVNDAAYSQPSDVSDDEDEDDEDLDEDDEDEDEFDDEDLVSDERDDQDEDEEEDDDC